MNKKLKRHLRNGGIASIFVFIIISYANLFSILFNFLYSFNVCMILALIINEEEKPTSFGGKEE